MYEYVEPYLPLRTRADRDRLTLRETHEHEAAYLVASLFALANSGRDVILREEGNFGRSMLLLKHAVVRPESVDDGRNPVDRRFIALLNAPWEDLPVHLRSVVSQLRAKDIGVNWHRLLEDLLFWTLPDRDVQRRWARRFWSEIKVADTREDDAVHTLQNAVGAEAPTDAADSL
jgi:CRISPR type I-E-associated protein CasB/Cse2